MGAVGELREFGGLYWKGGSVLHLDGRTQLNVQRGWDTWEVAFGSVRWSQSKRGHFQD